ncbi:unnamed protein product [Ectocarpus sp. 12 AP-2014]
MFAYFLRAPNCFLPSRLVPCPSRYYRHGLEDEDFLAAFEGVRTVERGYDGLARAFGGSSGSGEARIVW